LLSNKNKYEHSLKIPRNSVHITQDGVLRGLAAKYRSCPGL